MTESEINAGAVLYRHFHFQYIELIDELLFSNTLLVPSKRDGKIWMLLFQAMISFNRWIRHRVRKPSCPFSSNTD